MNNEGKKIAFSFSKVKKPALISKVNVETKDKIEYVDCFDVSKGKFSFKGTIKNEPHKQELVIPMPVVRTSTDIVKSKIEEKIHKITESNIKNNLEKNRTENSKECLPNINDIDELAALEILKEAQNENVENKSTNKLVIETKSFEEAPSETEIDYYNVPVNEFGLALLRGMGWRPDLGIGKEPRLIEATSPKLRPKGLGLGAQLKPEVMSKKKETSNSLSSSHRKHKESKSMKDKR